MMRAFPRSAQAFMWLVILIAAILSILFGASLHFPAETSARLVLFLLIVASVLADFYHIHLNYKIEITMSTASNFAAVLVFGGPVAAIVGVVGSVGGDFLLKKPWYKIIFNASNTTLSVALSAVAYWLLNDGSVLPLSSARNAGAIALSGVAYLFSNTSLVCLVIALVERLHVWDVARSNFRGVTFQFVTLIPLGTLVTIVYYQSPWGLVLLLFPILMTYYASENYQRLRTESQNTIELLADAVDRRDPYTYQHSVRVAHYAERIAHRMKLDIDSLTTIVFAARIHDLGKISIDDAVLLKKAGLEPHERRIIELHPHIGATIMSSLSVYEGVRDLIAYHHEWVNGRGYPRGLKGDQIPLGARIIAVADGFEAMTADRPYRKALSEEAAIAELERGKGRQFDAQMVDFLVSILREDRQAQMAPMDLELSLTKRRG